MRVNIRLIKDSDLSEELKAQVARMDAQIAFMCEHWAEELLKEEEPDTTQIN